MNALIKKEIRLLLPAWIAAMLLAIIPAWFAGNFYSSDTFYIFLGFCFELGIVFLSIASFGQEFSFGTFNILLSQPIERRRIWFFKMMVLAVAFISVLLALFVSWKFYFYFSGLRIQNDFKFLSLYSIAFFSGGLWTTILLRQVIGAFWFTLILPVALVFLVSVLLDNFSSNGAKYSEICIVSVLLIYSIVGFFWARRMFLRAQDMQWTGGEISFPWRKKSSTQTAASFSSQPRHWFSALVRKEFQLHQGTILISVLVLALHLASVFIRKVHPNFENPNVKFILDVVFALWLLMPLLIGCAAVAEERRLGVIESQLCLPVSRRAQLFIKFSIALILSLVLGGLMPLLVERAKDLDFHIFYVAAIIFFISFYASTLARTTIQAIGIAIGICANLWAWVVGVGFGMDRLQREQNNSINPYQVFFLFYLTGGILLLVLTRLAFSNFKWLHENWKLWRRNLIMVVTALAFSFALANAIYFRAWELLMSNDVPLGATRLNISKPPKLLISYNAISVLLPNGKLWSEATDFYSSEKSLPHFNTQHYVGDSNWVDAASDGFRVMAIQANGTLWSFQTYGGWKGVPLYPLTQIGSDTNWFRVVDAFGFFLLKNDLTLWSWGTESRGVSSDQLKKYLIVPPQQLDQESNWVNVFSYNNNSGPFAQKNDGSFWYRAWETNSFHLHKLESWQLPNRGFVSVSSFGEWVAGTKTNGEFWLTLEQENEKPKEIQLGRNEKWKSVILTQGDSLIALRADGTLWKNSRFWNLNPNSISQKLIQLGNHSDWIAISQFHYYSTLALAADGSLWIWNEPSAHVWLAPSRKPVFVGNIFQGTKME